MTGKICAASALLAGLWVGCAQAALVISTAATSNVSCSGGVCTATAANAVLNAHDLMVSLAHGDMTLVSGSTAQDIEFDTPVHWTSAHRLTLDSYHAITFTQPVISEGTGGITMTTNDGGTGGDIYFTGKGRVALWDLGSALTINGKPYTLVNNVAGLAAAVSANPAGRIAFANIYNASVDGVYSQSPVAIDFDGTFEGLGNTISHLTVDGGRGLFSSLGPSSTQAILRDIVLSGTVIRAPSGKAGALVAWNYGTVIGASSIGGMVSVASGDLMSAGGLVGRLDFSGGRFGTVIRSFSSTRVVCGNFCAASGLVGSSEEGRIRQSGASGAVAAGNHANAGGLLGENDGSSSSVALSFATGSVTVRNAFDGANTNVIATAGGLVGHNAGMIDQSYATGTVSGGSGLKYATNHVWVGGLVGLGDYDGSATRSLITHSYARGAVSVGAQGDAGGFAGKSPSRYTTQCYSTGAVSTSGASEIGGFVGYDTWVGGYASAHDYWDLDTSGVSDPGKGAGNTTNDQGITGLTTAQLQSGLPSGFDPTIWAESAGINNGLPYLLDIPPQ